MTSKFLKTYDFNFSRFRHGKKKGVAKLICPIDGFKAVAVVDKDWMESIQVDFKSDVCMETGEIYRKEINRSNIRRYTIKHRGAFENYNLKLLEIEKIDKLTGRQSTEFKLWISGSFHKSSQRNNSKGFFVHELKRELLKLSENLKIELTNIEVKNIEFGFNIELEDSPSIFIENIKSYRRRVFYDMGVKNGRVIGKCCALSEYRIKLYDKGLQSNSGFRRLRFEVKIIKMRKLACRYKRKAIFLSDLLDNKLLFEMKWMLIELGKKLTWDASLNDQRPIRFNQLPKDNKVKLLLQKIVLLAFGKNKFPIKIKA